jgi:hypothetical protein
MIQLPNVSNSILPMLTVHFQANRWRLPLSTEYFFSALRRALIHASSGNFFLYIFKNCGRRISMANVIRQIKFCDLKNRNEKAPWFLHAL